jgi:hypothetical protein
MLAANPHVLSNQPFNSNKAEERRVQLKKERQNCIDIFLVTNFYLSTSSDLIYK